MQIDAVEKDIDTTEMKWPDLMVHDWPVDEIFKGRLQTDNYILFFIYIYININFYTKYKFFIIHAYNRAELITRCNTYH